MNDSGSSDLMRWLKAEFSQGKLLKKVASVTELDMKTPAGGICQELSWLWLRMIHQARPATPEDRLASFDDVELVVRCVDVSRAVSKNPMKYVYVLLDFMKTEVSERYNFDEPSLDSFDHQGGGIHIQFMCPKYGEDAKHAIAAYTPPRLAPTKPTKSAFKLSSIFKIGSSKSKPSTSTSTSIVMTPNISVFDANEGELEVPPHEFRAWLTNYLLEKYGAVLVRDTKNICRYPVGISL